MSMFDMNCLGAKLGGWDDKDRTAAKYKSADSNYRTYTPAGGLFISTKIDHIRGGAADDHTQLEMEFDPNGHIATVRTVMSIQGNPNFDSGLIKAAADLYDDRYGQIAEVAAKLANNLINFISQISEVGGRANFPAVVGHNINSIAECVATISAGDPMPGSRISLGKVDAQGDLVSYKEHGPFDGWTALNYADGSILWRG